jgi:hypothetical protein
VIEKILPAAVACSEAFDDSPDAVLFPEEEAVISRAVEKRRREFRTVRLCARRALRGRSRRPTSWVQPGVTRSRCHRTIVAGATIRCSRPAGDSKRVSAGDHRSVRPRQSWSADLARQHCHLVPEHQDLRVLRS